MTAAITPMNLHQSAWLEPNGRQLNLWWQSTLMMLGLLFITLLLWWVDLRQLDGVSVWAKPLKFQVSVIIYFVTLSLLASFLPQSLRETKAWRWASLIGAGAGILEVIYITLQAARGRASHYNNDTQLEAIFYGLMGVGAVLMVVVSFYLGWLLYRDYRSGDKTTLKLAAAWGLMLGSVLTLITASVMSSGTSHFAGTPAPDAFIVPIVGWSLSGGDLRIPHFFATHLMQFLPLYGWWLQRCNTKPAAAKNNILIFAVVSVLLILGLFGASFIS